VLLAESGMFASGHQDILKTTLSVRQSLTANSPDQPAGRPIEQAMRRSGSNQGLGQDPKQWDCRSFIDKATTLAKC
jgi:hypothetical protein